MVKSCASNPSTDPLQTVEIYPSTLRTIIFYKPSHEPPLCPLCSTFAWSTSAISSNLNYRSTINFRAIKLATDIGCFTSCYLDHHFDHDCYQIHGLLFDILYCDSDYFGAVLWDLLFLWLVDQSPPRCQDLRQDTSPYLVQGSCRGLLIVRHRHPCNYFLFSQTHQHCYQHD